MTATDLEKPTSTEKSDSEERVAIAVLSQGKVNNFGLLMFREAVRLALEGEGVKAEWIGGFYGHGLAGCGLPFVKGVGGFVVAIAGVEDRQGALKALHEAVPEKALPYETAWWDKAEEYWRTAHSSYAPIQFDRFLTKEIAADFEALLKTEQSESKRYYEALNHFTFTPRLDQKLDAIGE
jgi:hypothetical protein